MGYKILGFAVWRAGKWYLKRRAPGMKRKAAIGALGALAVGGLVVAQRQHAAG
jgi:hypothetical protein